MKTSSKEKALAMKIINLRAELAREVDKLEGKIAERRREFFDTCPRLDEELVPISLTEARRWMWDGLPESDRKWAKKWFLRYSFGGRFARGNLYEMDPDVLGVPVLYAKNADGVICRYRGSEPRYGESMLVCVGNGSPIKNARRAA